MRVVPLVSVDFISERTIPFPLIEPHNSPSHLDMVLLSGVVSIPADKNPCASFTPTAIENKNLRELRSWSL